MSEDNHRHITIVQFLTSILLALCVIALLHLIVQSCSDLSPKKTTPSPTPAPLGAANPQTPAPGSAPSATPAPSGSPSPAPGSGPTPAPAPGQSPTPAPSGGSCSKTVFADVQPLLQQFCVGCHATMPTFATASALADQISQRVGLPENDNNHMPEKAATQLCAPLNAANDPGQPTNCGNSMLIQKWVSDGALNQCPDNPSPSQPSPPTPPPPNSLVTQDYLDSLALADASGLSAADRPFTQYLTTASVLNDPNAGLGIGTCIDAMNKGLNSLNPTGSDLVPVKALDKQGSLFRIDIRNYGMSQQQLSIIQNNDVNINIVDNTSKGILLQQLLGQLRPIMDADNFLDLTYRNAAIYYNLLRVPTTLLAFQRAIGVNFSADLANLGNNPVTGQPQLAFVGDIGQITLNKNRMIVRDVQNTSGTAYYYQTFDVNGQPHNVIINKKHVDSKNLFQVPLLPGTGANAVGSNAPAVFTFTQDASETIYQLPNGLQGWALWDAKGNRLDAADPNVVVDAQSDARGFGNVITASNTCSECHNNGIIPMGDTVLAQVQSNADQFTANDVQLVGAVYHGPAKNAAMFQADAAAFGAALARLSVKPGADPQTTVSYRFRGNWTLAHICAQIRLSIADCTTAINESPTTKAAIGQVLAGGTVPFTTFAGVFQQLIKDAHLFQDPITQ